MHQARERTRGQTIAFWTMIGIVWVVIVLIALIAVWLWLGTGEAHRGSDMSPLALTVLTADAASMCVLWVAWIYRPRYRPCARCGRRVKVGELECSHCGFDFHTIGA